MPLIVYKTLKLNIRYAQARRIKCEHCKTPFTYVWGDRQEFQATGIPLVSSDEGMRKSAMSKAVDALTTIAKSANRGESMCPSCHCYQGWMVRKSWLSRLGCGVAAGLVGGGVAAIALGIWLLWSSAALLAVIAAGALLGVAIGARLAKRTGPHPGQVDPSAMKDADVPAYLQACQEKAVDPIVFWYVSQGNEPAEKEILVSLGAFDMTGLRTIFPRELGTTHVLQTLRH